MYEQKMEPKGKPHLKTGHVYYVNEQLHLTSYYVQTVMSCNLIHFLL